jgi:NADH-ubiquinone oxidoreductase chain 4L
MVLGIYLIFLISLGLTFYFYSLVYLIFTACEGALGLSILVVIGRTHGRDYFTSFSSLIN